MKLISFAILINFAFSQFSFISPRFNEINRCLTETNDTRYKKRFKELQKIPCKNLSSCIISYVSDENCLNNFETEMKTECSVNFTPFCRIFSWQMMQAMKRNTNLEEDFSKSGKKVKICKDATSGECIGYGETKETVLGTDIENQVFFLIYEGKENGKMVFKFKSENEENSCISYTYGGASVPGPVNNPKSVEIIVCGGEPPEWMITVDPSGELKYSFESCENPDRCLVWGGIDERSVFVPYSSFKGNLEVGPSAVFIVFTEIPESAVVIDTCSAIKNEGESDHLFFSVIDSETGEIVNLKEFGDKLDALNN